MGKPTGEMLTSASPLAAIFYLLSARMLQKEGKVFLQIGKPEQTFSADNRQRKTEDGKTDGGRGNVYDVAVARRRRIRCNQTPPSPTIASEPANQVAGSGTGTISPSTRIMAAPRDVTPLSL